MPRPAAPEAILGALSSVWRQALEEASEILEVPVGRILELAETLAFQKVSLRVQHEEDVSQRLGDIGAGIELDVDERVIRRRIQRLRECCDDNLSQPPSSDCDSVAVGASKPPRLES